jgi:hypothetical protein
MLRSRTGWFGRQKKLNYMCQKTDDFETHLTAGFEMHQTTMFESIIRPTLKTLSILLKLHLIGLNCSCSPLLRYP